jgi:hypothetical protein
MPDLSDRSWSLRQTARGGSKDARPIVVSRGAPHVAFAWHLWTSATTCHHPARWTAYRVAATSAVTDCLRRERGEFGQRQKRVAWQPRVVWSKRPRRTETLLIRPLGANDGEKPASKRPLPSHFPTAHTVY